MSFFLQGLPTKILCTLISPYACYTHCRILDFFELVLVYYKVSRDVTIVRTYYYPLNARFQLPDLTYHQHSPTLSFNISYLVVALSRFFFKSTEAEYLLISLQ
jgi:hypothetical protein